ncbi:MAG: nucleoside 2-deoxyribosyltransferase [Euryarchaeota archaeon]|nr:nucleoside 2-deoxyribosyltransferase [Euryarchaeota archaeon]
MRIYIAAPLFSAAEREYNLKLSRMLAELGHEVFLPQHECSGSREEIFRCCLSGIDSSDLVVAVLDGASCDDGTAFELGYAYALGKRILGLRTDFRNVGEHGGVVNLMLAEACEHMVRDESSLIALLGGIENAEEAEG